MKPTVGAPSDALANIEERLAQLESRMDSTQQMVQQNVIQSPNVSNHSDLRPTNRSKSRQSSLNSRVTDHINNATMSNQSPIAYDFAYRQTSTEASAARPSLIAFHAPPYIQVESWDYSADFYDDELAAGEQLADQCDELAIQPVDLSRRMSRRLLQSFVENFLRWTPILDQRKCVEALEQAEIGGFSYPDSSTCLAFMILALGAISEDLNEGAYNLTPGLEYFARGSRILERLALRTGSLITLQCRILQASYFKFAIRPLLTWNAITQAARDCMHILSSRSTMRMTPTEQEAFNRAFWACSTILHELVFTSEQVEKSY